MNDIAAGLADELAHVEYVDAYTMFLNEEGEFDTWLTDENGKRVRVRSGDGVHFYNIAGYWMADAVFELVNADLPEGVVLTS